MNGPIDGVESIIDTVKTLGKERTDYRMFISRVLGIYLKTSEIAVEPHQGASEHRMIVAVLGVKLLPHSGGAFFYHLTETGVVIFVQDFPGEIAKATF
jgi:hypothetical protein